MAQLSVLKRNYSENYGLKVGVVVDIAQVRIPSSLVSLQHGVLEYKHESSKFKFATLS